MKPLPLITNMPWSITIAADARLTTTDYGDDAIYAVQAADGPLALTSTYGGRCTSMACVLLWRDAADLRQAHAVTEYVAPLVLHDYGPGFALLETQPLPGLVARIVFLAHSSHVTVCAVEMRNTTAAPSRIGLTVDLQLELHAPRDQAAAPTPLTWNDQTVGAYVSGGLSVPLNLALCWDIPGSYSATPSSTGNGWSLARDSELALAPDEVTTCHFGLLTATAQSEKPSVAQSLASMARTVLAMDWAAELARQRAASAAIPDIETGNAEWDATIACAYRMAARCYLTGSGDSTPRPEVPVPDGRAPDIHHSGLGYPPLPYASFVFTRTPQQGYPHNGDPQNHSWQWNGQVATEAYVNIPEVASFAPELGKAVLRNYLYIQQADGFIDWKPGLAGQRACWDCIPLLATIARMICDYSGDLDFLHEVYDGLLRHLDRWFAPANDRNDDGFPEWSHSVQSAFDDNPSFVPWRSWAQGADFTKALSPDLGAYLYREHQELIGIARLLPDQRRLALNADIVRLTHRADRLRTYVEALWNAEQSTYLYADRDSHLTHTGELVWETHGSGVWQHARAAEGGNGKVRLLSPPIPPPNLARRVVVRIEGAEAPNVTILLQGYDANDQPIHEVLTRDAFGWWGGGDDVVSATSVGRFASLTEIHVTGIAAQQFTRISFVDYTRQDQTQLLPLWAGIPAPDRAETLVRRTITDPVRFWRPYGIPNCSAQDPAYASNNSGGSGGVWMMWNTMIGEGLCDYGYFAEAWELFSRILAAQVSSLKVDHCFREAYDSDTGQGLGSPDYLWGTVPLHLLTRLHGVQILPAPDNPNSARAVRLLPADTLGRHIRVRQRGVTVERHDRQATITWPDGRTQTYTVADASVLIVL